MASWRAGASEMIPHSAANSSRIHSPGNAMVQRQECIAQASLCRAKAQADPARYDFWIDEAVAWHQRAIQPGRDFAVSPELPEPAIDIEAGTSGPPQLA